MPNPIDSNPYRPIENLDGQNTFYTAASEGSSSAEPLDLNTAIVSEDVEKTATLDLFNSNKQVEGKKVLIISSEVQDAEVLAKAAADGTIVIQYDFNASSLQDIKQLLEAKLQGEKAASIAFVNHGEEGQFHLSSQTLVSANTIKTNFELRDFFKDLGESLKSGGRLDLLGCNLAAGESGVLLMNSLENLIGKNVAASTNSTGNSINEADWLLETDDVDVRSLYFSDKIKEWNGTLAMAWSEAAIFKNIPWLDGRGDSIRLDPFNLDNSQPITISFNAILPPPNNTLAADEPWQTIFDFGYGKDNNNVILEYNPASRSFRIRNQNTINSNCSMSSTTFTAAQLNQTGASNPIVLTINSGSVTLKVGSTTNTMALEPPATTTFDFSKIKTGIRTQAYIGKSNDPDNPQNFFGKINNFKIVNGGVTQANYEWDTTNKVFSSTSTILPLGSILNISSAISFRDQQYTVTEPADYWKLRTLLDSLGEIDQLITTIPTLTSKDASGNEVLVTDAAHPSYLAAKKLAERLRALATKLDGEKTNITTTGVKDIIDKSNANSLTKFILDNIPTFSNTANAASDMAQLASFFKLGKDTFFGSSITFAREKISGVLQILQDNTRAVPSESITFKNAAFMASSIPGAVKAASAKVDLQMAELADAISVRQQVLTALQRIQDVFALDIPRSQVEWDSVNRSQLTTDIILADGTFIEGVGHQVVTRVGSPLMTSAVHLALAGYAFQQTNPGTELAGYFSNSGVSKIIDKASIIEESFNTLMQIKTSGKLEQNPDLLDLVNNIIGDSAVAANSSGKGHTLNKVIGALNNTYTDTVASSEVNTFITAFAGAASGGIYINVNNVSGKIYDDTGNLISDKNTKDKLIVKDTSITDENDMARYEMYGSIGKSGNGWNNNQSAFKSVYNKYAPLVNWFEDQDSLKNIQSAIKQLQTLNESAQQELKTVSDQFSNATKAMADFMNKIIDLMRKLIQKLS